MESVETTEPRASELGALVFDAVTNQIGVNLLDLLPAAIYACDAEGRILLFNRRAAELWGREPALNDSAALFCGSHRLYRLDGGPLPHDECPMADVLKTGIPVRNQEVVVERQDGQRAVALVNINPLLDQAGRIVGAVNCFHDITARKRAELEQFRARDKVEALTKKISSERDRSKALLEALPAAVYTTDGAGRVTYYNEAAARLWGCRPQIGKAEFCGSWKLYRLDGTPMAHDECPMARALKERRPIRGERAIAERPDGTRIQFIPFPTPLFDDKGNLTGAVNMLVDAAEQQQFEEVRQRLAAVVESSTDAIVSKNLDGIILSWNKGAERIFGYKAEEAIGRSILLLIPAHMHDEEFEILSRLRRGERIEHYETIRCRKDGTLINVSLSVSPLYGSCGEVIGASKIARDITERKNAEARQELLSNELQHRTRNIFSVVRSVVTRSFDGKRNVTAAKAAVLQRLHSLSQTHEMLIVNEWWGANLRDVVNAEMDPYSDRIVVEGPTIDLNVRAAQDFALAIHELATNAAKYGALSNESGKVLINWSVSHDGGENRFKFQWREQGGPPVRPPRKKGFGSSVVIRVMATHTDSPPVIEFAADGLRYELSGPLDRIAMDESVARDQDLIQTA